MLKKCTNCDMKKEYCEFSFCDHTLDNHQSWCKNCVKEYQRKYREKNKEKIKGFSKNHYIKNKIQINRKACDRRWEQKLKVIKYYGGCCVCCGEKEPKFLTIDHINNDGGYQRKTRTGMHHYDWIIKTNYPKDLQVLCYNCNCAKGFFGRCPHNEET